MMAAAGWLHTDLTVWQGADRLTPVESHIITLLAQPNNY